MKLLSQSLMGLPDDQYAPQLLRSLGTLYDFLETDFHCSRVSLPDGFSYANETTVVHVRSEYEGPWVGIDRLNQPFVENGFGFSIWSIMTVTASKYLYAPDGPMIDKFHIYSDAIAECGRPMMLGEFAIAPRLLEFARERESAMSDWYKRLQLDSQIENADAAFRSKDYVAAVQRFEEIESELSKSLLLKLKYARDRL